MIDPAAAKEAILSVYGVLTVIVLGALGFWARLAKTRKNVGSEDGDRLRLSDAISDARLAKQDARDAWKEAHDTRNEMMTMQRTLGRLEAENAACAQDNKELRDRITVIEEQNETQANQIRALIARNQQTDLGRGLR